jgi:hypothetical protein
MRVLGQESGHFQALPRPEASVPMIRLNGYAFDSSCPHVFAVMDDHPRTLMEFESGFPTDAACRDFLARVRWPQGPVGRAPVRGLVDGARPMEVRGLLAPTLADRGDDLPGHPDPADVVVPRDPGG